MRRIYNIAIIIAAIAIFCVGCKKEGTQSFTVPSEGILIEFAHAGDTGTTTFQSHNISAIDVTSTPKGWSVVDIDMYTKTITVKSPESFDNEEERSGTISLSGYTPNGTKVTISIYVPFSRLPTSTIAMLQPTATSPISQIHAIYSTPILAVAPPHSIPTISRLFGRQATTLLSMSTYMMALQSSTSKLLKTRRTRP